MILTAEILKSVHSGPIIVVMRYCLSLIGALGLTLLAVVPAAATTIVPAADPGELALDSEAVFLARAGMSRAVERPSFLATETELEVLAVVSGPLVAGEKVAVAVPGGEIDGVGWAVAGSPRFIEGEVYLLFADRGADGRWRPRLLADSVLRQEHEADGTSVLVPLEEARGLDRIGASQGAGALIPAPVDEARFLNRLRRSLEGEAGWSWTPLMASSASTWLELKEAPAGCVFMRSASDVPIRWKIFEEGGSQGLWADDAGEASITGGGFDEVNDAIGRWMGVAGTSLDLTYNGSKSFTMSCTSSSDQDAPRAGADVVVFDDPCDDIDDLVNCGGTLAFGGPWFGALHRFDDQNWFTASSWFVVVNNGVGECLQRFVFELMITHELGHGLGFGHTEDSESLMNATCCHEHNALDFACAQYLYPAQSTESAQVTVPVIAYVNGVGGTPWRTNVTIANPTDGGLTVDLTYQAGGEPPVTVTRSLPAMASLFYEDIVPTLFDARDGRGPLRMTSDCSGDLCPVIVSRTYAERSFGNFGSGVPADVVPAAGAVTMPGLFEDGEYRSNLSVTADVGSPVDATFELFRGGDGLVRSNVRRTVPAGEQEQWSLDQLFPGLARDGVPMTVRVTMDQPGVASASVVDNVSTDSAVILGKQPSTGWIVPVVAHIPGRDNTEWTSEVSLWNASGGPVTVHLEYLPEKTDNSAAGITSPEIHIAAFESLTLEDVVLGRFGIDNGKGTLLIEASGSVTVTSRVATAGPNGGTSGNGVRTFHDGAWSKTQAMLPGVRMRDGFRTNVGFISGAEAITVRCKLFNMDGALVAEGSVNVKPRSLRQLSVERIFGSSGYTVPDPVGAIIVEGDGDFLAYLTVIDGTSQDPVFVMPK